MTKTLFPAPDWPVLDVIGESAGFPLRRIFCVGKNYAAHAAEMGGQVDREQPIFFTKSALAFQAGGCEIPYPPGTSNYHYEAELCVLIDKPLFKADMDEAAEAVFGYAVGLDMTRRDIQERARGKGLPWDMAKDVEQSAIIGPATRAEAVGSLDGRRITLRLDGELRQDGPLSDMIWSIPELLSRLSGLYHLAPGDLVMTGTPAGVGPVAPGNRLVAEVGGLAPALVTFTDPQ
ncbi:MAG: fumarylacetoacetate hydrolase family protein [Paracoccus sp. (in: a-proteobacteria)]